MNKQMALYLLRHQRAARERCGLADARTNMLAPDPFPGKRWTHRLLDPRNWGLGIPLEAKGLPSTVDVCVGSAAERLKSRYASSTVYKASIPDNSFLRVSQSVAISCPELLFVELAATMSPAEHLQLGLELCGRFSRDEEGPVNGEATMNVPAATSTEKISAYMEAANYLTGTGKARRTLRLLADDAWSPAESVVATMMALPFEEYGYGLGRLELNPRIATPDQLEGTTDKNSRVPDILVAGTSVGINYDGDGHLELGSIARVGIGLGQDPGSAQRERELDEALRKVRAKALDDIRRDRELAADGLTVFTVYKEDLYEYGGLDKVMMQVLTVLEQREGWDASRQMGLLRSSFARRERQALVYSMMPGGWQVPPSNEDHAFARI